MYIVLSQKIDTSSPYNDELFKRYHYPARYRNQIHEGDNFVYYQGNRYNKKLRYYFGCGTIGSIKQASDGDYYAELLFCRKFDSIVPIYLDNNQYVEQLGYETVRNSIIPPWQSSIRPISLEAYNYLLEFGFRKDCNNKEINELTVEEIKQLLKDPIRKLYRENSAEAALEAKEYIDQLVSILSVKAEHEKERVYLEFRDYCKSTRILYSYKLVTILACIEEADINGKTSMNDLIVFTRDYYRNRKTLRRIVEKNDSIFLNSSLSDSQIKHHLISNPIRALISTDFFSYDQHQDAVLMNGGLWESMGNKEKTEIIQICVKRLKDYFENMQNK